MFSEFVLTFLIHGALGMAAAGGVTLIVLLVRDVKQKRTW